MVMAGSVAANFHEGSRSELLADYLFSTWGTVTPVRRQDDYGVDLYCTLTARSGQRAVVTGHYAVQVKSTTDPWVLNDEQSVRWLIEHPTPLFLACVDKAAGVLQLYHLMSRFYVWAMGTLPARLELRPEDVQDGGFVSWQHGEGGESFSLSAPILRATIADLVNGAALDTFREVLACWVQFDRENCDLVRQGLLRFRMPHTYRVNEVPKGGLVEQGLSTPEQGFLRRGILASAEGAECVGGQLGRSGDRRAALFAALFVDHLQRTYPDAFVDARRWGQRLPGDLGYIVGQSLNEALSDGHGPPYQYSGIDAVTEALCSNAIVKKFLNSPAAQQLSGLPESSG
jgi:hypothetical protein